MRRLLIGCVLVAVAVGLSASPAQAQTKVRQDPVGDALSFVDITSATVQNNARKYALTVRFSEVVHKNTTIFAYISRPQPAVPAASGDEAEAPGFLLMSVPISRGRHRTELYRFDNVMDAEPPRPLRCGVRGRWKEGRRGLIRIVVPQRCFGAEAGRLQTVPITVDKQAGGLRTGAHGVPPRLRSSLAGLRRGDAVEPGSEDEEIDLLDSLLITTRRGR